MNLRIQLAAALLALTLGGWECGAISGGGAMSNGSVGGPRVVASAPAVVGIDWPFEPTILLEFGKETTFTDLDPIETPTNFGSDSAVGLTQGTLGSRPQFQSPCDVGPAIPCAYFDGGDSWAEPLARAALAYLHDGTGMTCYAVVEYVAGTAADSIVLATGGWNSTDRGAMLDYSSLATDRFRAYASNNTAMSINGNPTGGVFGDGATRGGMLTHGTSRNPDFEIAWRGPTSAPTTATGNYAAAPDTGDPDFPLTVGKRAGGVGGQLTGYLFALACEDALHDATMIANTWDAIEAVTGALPQ